MTKVWNFKAEKGKAKMTEYVKASLLQDQKDHNGYTYQIKRLSKESRKGRGFLHGGVYSIWAYLNDLDYKDNKVLERIHEYAKEEFNGEIIVFDKKRLKVGKSTRGILNEFTERVVYYIEENYGVDRLDVLNPEDYKYFRDEIYSEGEYDDYIMYLKDKGKLK